MNANQPRKPKGTPIGGQWTAQELAAAQAALVDGPRSHRPSVLADPAVAQLLQERRDQLAATGFSPARLVTRAAAAPRSTAHIDQWWENQMLSAEYTADGAGVPQLPDDYGTKGHGNALSGRRRTSRMRYEAGGVELRMPSRTAIGSFFKDTGATTVDVPVAAGTAGNGAVQGWVRVTRHGPGVYSAQGLGMSGKTEVLVAEAVAATLEGRTASNPVRTYGDLVQRRLEREAAAGASPVRLGSSWLEEVAYDDATGVMYTEMAGRKYGHRVPRSVYERVVAAPSPGAVFNRDVKGHERVGVTRCESCGRFSVEASAHVCPAAAVAQPVAGPVPQNVLAGTRVGLFAPPPAPAAPTVPATPGHVKAADEKTVDLGASWRRQAEEDRRGDDERQVYGPRGWTIPAAELLAENASSTYSPYSFSSFLGSEIVNDGDYVRVNGVSGAKAGKLLGLMTADCLAERQGDGPTGAALLRAAAENADAVELHGYLTSPVRADERVTIEGLHVYDDDLVDELPEAPAEPFDDSDDEWSVFEEASAQYREDVANFYHRVAQRYGLDSVADPDEMHVVTNPWRPEERALRIWWD